MNFSNSFKFSLAAHASILGAALVFTFLQGWLSTKSQDVPMFDLIQGEAFDNPAPTTDTPVDNTPPQPEAPPPPPPPPIPLPPPPPIPDPEADNLIDKAQKPPKVEPKPEVKKPEPKPEVKKPEPKPEPKKDITQNAKPMTREEWEKKNNKTPSFADRTPVDPKAISGALNVGTPTQGNPKLTATENQAINAAIQNAMRKEWEKEANVSALEGNQWPIVEITLAANGRVTDAKITTSSGSKIYDDAALRAARRANIPEVTPAFLGEMKNKVQVRFKFN